ncbi:MAG TPA: chloride channel protein [Ktedonobacterales bacterium]|jgi:H+/Cl- antiporter ClcA
MATTDTNAATLTASNALAIIRSRNYLGLLLIAVILGVPVSLCAYGFLALVHVVQTWMYTTLPALLPSATLRLWWPLIPLTLAGLLVGLTIRLLPGRGGEVSVDGFHVGGGPPRSVALPGIVLAAFVSIALGAVIGPEAPLIAMGGGLAVWWIQLVKRPLPAPATTMVGAAGSFAAISALLGSPITSAFLLMEASGQGGTMLDLALLPGLLAAGIGYLVFVGLDAWTGLGTFSLSVPHPPPFAGPTVAELGWALGIGLVAAALIWLLRALVLNLGARLDPDSRPLRTSLLAGVGVALLAIGFVALTGQSESYILFSGQNQMGQLIDSGANLSIGTLLLILLLKGLGYSLSLMGFRGGAVFPSLYLGAAVGVLLSHLPGLPIVAGVAMGMGAMTAAMLKLPLTAVLLSTLILASDGIALIPLVIVAVVVAYVTTMRLPRRRTAPAANVSPPVRAAGAPG